MKRRVLAAGIVAAAMAMLGCAGSAAAGNAVSTYTFYDCTGPGVPSTFMAVKTALPNAAPHGVSAAGAFLVVGSSDVYTVYDFGFGSNSGIPTSGVATDWCWVNYAGIGPALAGGVYHGG